VTEESRTVRIERTFDAPAEEVFDAWTSEEVIRRWFKPSAGWREPRAEVDLSVGGTIRVMMRDPEGAEVGARGEYTLIDRPRKLTFTWTFDDDPSNEQLIELEFNEVDGVTTVVFVNSQISDEERRASQQDGWSHIFDEFERALGS
jgi:uncharacterized protein YndB with AHSA1/START domain